MFPSQSVAPLQLIKALLYLQLLRQRERRLLFKRVDSPFCANQRNQSKLDLYLVVCWPCAVTTPFQHGGTPPSSSWTAAGPISCVRERVRRFHFVFIESLMAIWNVCLVLCVFPYTTRWYTRKFISSTPFWGLVPGPWWVCFTREKLSSIYTVIEKISI